MTALDCSVVALQSLEEPECDNEASQEDEGFMGMSPLLQAHHAMERMEEFVCKVRWPGLSFPCCMFSPSQGEWSALALGVLCGWCAAQ